MTKITWPILLLCLLVGHAHAGEQPLADARPNILWITLEDTSTQFIGAYGNPHVKTPAIDGLAKQGVRFTSAFATASVCSTARSAIITGVSPEVLGTGHHRSRYPIPKFIKGFPSYLKDAGYYTTNSSKTDYNTSEESRIKRESWNECSSKAGWWKREKGQPFFAVFNFMNSHQSRTMTWSYKQYKKKILNKLSGAERTAPDEFEMPPFYRDSPEMRKQMSRVYNSLNYTDREIAKLLRRLKDEGLMDDTIIFLYADHGEGMPCIKGNSIGMSYRVPLVVWFPEKYRHLNPWGDQAVSDELICFEDLAPTMLSLAGLEVPGYMNGRAVIGKQRKPAPEFVFAARHRCGEGLDVVRSVTDGRYVYSRVFLPHYPAFKYHKYFDDGDISKKMRQDLADGKLNAVQRQLFEPRSQEYLVDIKQDLWESKNLATDPGHRKQLEKMRAAVFNRIEQKRDVHFLPEYELDKITRKTLAYEFRKDKTAYPLRQILSTAKLVGDSRALPQQLERLTSELPMVRYWAAVGISAQDENALPHKTAILKALDDPHPCVKIEMAILAWKLFRDQKAKRIIEVQLKADNPYLVWQVLQGILYMDGEARDLLPLVEALKEAIDSNKSHPARHGLVSSSIAMLIYKFQNSSL